MMVATSWWLGSAPDEPVPSTLCTVIASHSGVLDEKQDSAV